MLPRPIRQSGFPQGGNGTVALHEQSKRRGRVPEDRVTESVVVLLSDIFIQVDWQSTILCSQLFRHTLLIRFWNWHSYESVARNSIAHRTRTRPSNPNKRHCLLQSTQSSCQSPLRDLILVPTLIISKSNGREIHQVAS